MNITNRSPRGSQRKWQTITTTLALLALAAASLTAQQFQYSYGGSDPSGDEGNAVAACTEGGYIAAGSGYFNGVPEMYFVRTDADGGVLWQKVGVIPRSTYSSEITDIEEYPNGDFIAVGNIWTSPTDRNAIILRIDANGNPVWMRELSLGGFQTDARSMVISASGDIILAGSVYTPSPGSADGLLARYTADGALVWAKTYDVLGNDDILYGVDEAQFYPYSNRALPTTKTAQHERALLNDKVPDIIAVGSSVPILGNGRDVWVLRVDGMDGTFRRVPPQGSALYGSPEDDYGSSIRHLRYGNSPDDMVITGRTHGRPGSGASEVIVMQLQADPCASPREVRFFGDDGGEDQWGLCIREIASANAPNRGNLIVSGGITNAGAGGTDAFLQEFESWTLLPVGATQYYGGTGDEEGRSLVEAKNAGTPGYALVGSTSSAELILSGNTKNIWLAKTNDNLSTSCREGSISFTDAPAPWTPAPMPITPAPGTFTSQPRLLACSTAGSDNWICHKPSKTLMPHYDAPEATGSIALETHPNPVPRGNSLSLSYTLPADGTVRITITDLLGRTIHERSSERTAGTTSEAIPTDAWSAGTYLATITSGGNSATRRIVLMER